MLGGSSSIRKNNLPIPVEKVLSELQVGRGNARQF
jgi:hypothetical protein